MNKRDELANPNSCMSRARDDEMTFVLLARDVAAPLAIRAWIEARIALGKNKWDDGQIIEAEQCARRMEMQRTVEHPFNVFKERDELQNSLNNSIAEERRLRGLHQQEFSRAEIAEKRLQQATLLLWECRTKLENHPARNLFRRVEQFLAAAEKGEET